MTKIAKYQKTAEDRQLAERAKAFAGAYKKLCIKYDVGLSSCGCCDGTQIYEGYFNNEEFLFVYNRQGQPIEFYLP